MGANRLKIAKGKARRGSRRWLWTSVALGIILLLAWFDGGEEPIHPIAQEIAVPEAG